LSQVSRARASINPQGFQRHRKNALIMNCVCTGVVVIVAIVEGLLRAFGVITE
jgi:hypothetical protein